MIPTSASTEVVEVEPKVTSERVLIVEDDTAARNGLVQLVKSWGFIAESAGDGEEALEKVTTFRPAIVITDMVMPRMDGLALLRALPQQGADVTTLLLTAQGTVETAVEAMKEGAYDYLTKPIDIQRLKILLDKIVERLETMREVKALRRQLREHGTFGSLIGNSPEMRKIYSIVDQQEAVKQGKLREDLFYRLNVFAFRLPPLRERKEDLQLLIQAFINEFNARNQKNIAAVDHQAMRMLEHYAWPGNVRELRNVIERATILAPGPFIEAKHLPPVLAEEPPPQHQPQVALAPGTTVEEAERRLILMTLEHTRDNKTRAAEILGISLKTLHNKLNKLRLRKKAE